MSPHRVSTDLEHLKSPREPSREPAPGGKTHVCGVNSLARLPVHGGVLSEDAAQLAGYCMPSVLGLKTPLHSGVRVAIVDRDAAASVPG